MFSHVMVGTNDIERSKRFYDALLGILGAGEPFRNQNATGQQRLFYRHDGSSFCVSEPINNETATIANGGTIGFNVADEAQGKAWHDAGVANGGTTCEDPPGVRDGGDMGKMYLAYMRDPSGNKLCALKRL